MLQTNQFVLAWLLSVVFVLSRVISLPVEVESGKGENSVTTLLNVTNSTGEMEPHAETCASPSEEFVSPVHGSPRCCRQCEPGTGMLRLCTDVEDTKCRPCDVGSEFSPISSATAKCQQCRRCQDLHPLAKTRTPCTPTVNTECECVADFYWSLPGQTCKPCTKCKPNEGVVKPCTWNTDTQCQACPSGFWSATTEDSVKCVPCQTCTGDQVVVKECSLSSDTVCCPKTNQNCTITDAFAYEYAASDPRDAGSSSSGDVVTKQNQMLPIYCSIMGMIIISLLLYVIYKLWKQREAMANAKLSEVFANGTANGLDKALIRSPNVTIGSAAAASPPISPVLVTVPEATTAIPTEGTYDQMHHHTQSPVSETHSHGRRSGRKVRDPHEVSTNSEKLPLISGAQTSLTDQDYMEKPLNSIPRNTLGFVCYSLAQNGWRDLAIATGLGSDHLDQLDQMKSDKRIQWPIPEDLFQAAQCAKSLESAGGVPPSEQDLMGAVLTVGKLMERPDMNVHTFCTALEKSTRLDLVSMLTKSNCPASNGS